MLLWVKGVRIEGVKNISCNALTFLPIDLYRMYIQICVLSNRILLNFFIKKFLVLKACKTCLKNLLLNPFLKNSLKFRFFILKKFKFLS